MHTYAVHRNGYKLGTVTAPNRREAERLAIRKHGPGIRLGIGRPAK